MAKVMAALPRGCTEHPHHEPIDHCDACQRPFCGECLVRGRPQLLCRRCWATAPEREARAARQRHPLYRRLDAMRENRPSAIAGGIILGALALLALSGAAQVLSPIYRTQVGAAVSAVSAARGAQRSPPPSLAAPGTAAAVPTRVPTLVLRPCCGPGAIAEQLPGDNGSALIDGLVGPRVPVWRSPAGFTTADLHLRVRNDVPAGQVLFAHSMAAPPDTWARDVEVWISLSPDGSDPIYLGQWRLAQTAEVQTFPFPPTRVSSVRLRILANYGNAQFTSLAAFALLPASG